MKKSIILLLAMVCAITACQVEEVRDVDECSSHHFCIETSFPTIEADNVETKTSIQPRITLKWTDGDLISVINLTTGKNLLGDLVARVSDDQVYFEGELSGSVKTGDKLAAIYPSQNYSGISNVTDISFDFSTQTCSSMQEVPFCAYSLFTCETVGVVKVESPFVIPVSFNQIAISNIEPNTKIEYVELSNVGNNLSLNVNKSTGTLDLTSTAGKVRIVPQAKQSGNDGSLFAYCALAESNASARNIVVKALPYIYTAQWAQSAMSTAKYYTSIASDFTKVEYKDFMVSEPSSLEGGAEGEKLIFNVSSNNKDWTVSSVPDLNITPSSGSNCENLEVAINVPKNEGFSEIAYLITFEAEGFKYTYSIKQGVLPSHKHIVFPDINLKKYLIDNYDLNDDGGISEDEAANISMVSCRNKKIADLTGLEECKNITTIDCSENYISEIKLPGLTKLVSLVCYGNPIEVLDLSNCSALKVLYIQSNSDNAIVEDELKLTYYDQAESLTIDVTNTIMDRIYICRSNTLANLDVSKNIHLTQLSAYVNPNLKSIDVSKLVNLEILDLGDCAFTNLDVSQNVLLTKLFVTNNKLSTLNVSQNKQLKVLKCNGNQISILKILNNDKLETIDASNNLLSSIILSNQPALKSVNINGNTEITLLDLSNSPSIESINAIRTNLSKLIVKNKQTIVAKEDAATNRKTYIEGINIVGRNGLSIFDANGTEIKSFNTPACIISGIEGVKSVNQTKYISLTLTSGSWASVEQTWTTKGWTIGNISSLDVRNDYKNILASYYDYFSENRYYWTPYEDSSYYAQGVGRGYYTKNYFGSKISESSAKGSTSHYSFGMYTEE